MYKKKKSKNVRRSGRAVCATWAPGAKVCFKHASLSVLQCSAVQLLCAARLSTLVSMTQIALVSCACAHRASETATSSSTTSLFSSSGELNALPPQKSTLQTGTTHENSKEILSTQALNLIAPRNEARRSRRDTSNYEGSLPNLITHRKHRRALLQRSSWPACVVNSCSRSGLFANSSVISAFTLHKWTNWQSFFPNHVFSPVCFPRLRRVEHSWPLLQ